MLIGSVNSARLQKVSRQQFNTRFPLYHPLYQRRHILYSLHSSKLTLGPRRGPGKLDIFLKHFIWTSQPLHPRINSDLRWRDLKSDLLKRLSQTSFSAAVAGCNGASDASGGTQTNCHYSFSTASNMVIPGFYCKHTVTARSGEVIMILYAEGPAVSIGASQRLWRCVFKENPRTQNIRGTPSCGLKPWTLEKEYQLQILKP